MAISFGLAILTLVGCGKGTPSVSGEVTYNGEPVETGYMTFNPVDKGRAFAAPITKGQFTIAEAHAGKFTAVASGSRNVNHYSSSADAYAQAQKTGGHVTEVDDYIAADAAGNRKEVEITSGEQVIDLAITGPPMPK